MCVSNQKHAKIAVVKYYVACLWKHKKYQQGLPDITVQSPAKTRNKSYMKHMNTDVFGKIKWLYSCVKCDWFIMRNATVANEILQKVFYSW